MCPLFEFLKPVFSALSMWASACKAQSDTTQQTTRPGVQQVPEGSGEQGKMEKTGCKIICGAQTTLAVKGLIMMMMKPQALRGIRLHFFNYEAFLALFSFTKNIWFLNQSKLPTPLSAKKLSDKAKMKVNVKNSTQARSLGFFVCFFLNVLLLWHLCNTDWYIRKCVTASNSCSWLALSASSTNSSFYYWCFVGVHHSHKREVT